MTSTSVRDLRISARELDAALDDYLDACLAQSLDATSLAEAQIIHTNLNPTYELIDNEHLRVSLFQEQIQRARAAIRVSRNSSSATVPINALPTEVLTRIFWLVKGAKFCQLNTWYPGDEKLPRYPVLLTHVCAHWRRIIIGTPAFWTHIDVYPQLHDSKSLWDRTQTFIKRTVCSPLAIHITLLYPTDEDWEANGLNELIAPLILRMRSLDLEMRVDNIPNYHAEPSAREFCSSILSNCLGINCVPGTLTQVSLKVQTAYSFLEDTENARNGRDIPVNVPACHLQDIWRYVTVLKLEDLFPPWTSTAYSGLAELSLGIHNPLPNTSIPESCLANILSSSPNLRVFEFGLPIVPADTPCAAVLLPNLDRLMLQPTTPNSLETIFRLLAPGQVLHQTLYIPRENRDEIANPTIEAGRFFARSKISSLHFVGVRDCFKLLGFLDTLQTLSITMYTPQDPDMILAYSHRDKLRPERLRLLCNGRFYITINVLLDLVRLYMPRRLLMWGAFYITHSHNLMQEGRSPMQEEVIIQELSTLGITVKLDFSDPPYPSEYSFISF